jgi:hypothetical protein
MRRSENVNHNDIAGWQKGRNVNLENISWMDCGI